MSATGDPALVMDRSPSTYVDRRGAKQSPARLGPVQILLIRLHRLVGERAYLEAARRYTDVVLDGTPGIYDCVEAHKFLWGIRELQTLGPDERFDPAAARITQYILSRQQPDGQWWGDVHGGGREGQPLELRVNTTANVLVGLAYELHLRTDGPGAGADSPRVRSESRHP